MTVERQGASTWTSTRGYPHHTAILANVKGDSWQLIEQNMNGAGSERNTFDLRTVTRGDYIVYRPKDCAP
jgi:hypothetical protein